MPLPQGHSLARTSVREAHGRGRVLALCAGLLAAGGLAGLLSVTSLDGSRAQPARGPLLAAETDGARDEAPAPTGGEGQQSGASPLVTASLRWTQPGGAEDGGRLLHRASGGRSVEALPSRLAAAPPPTMLAQGTAPGLPPAAQHEEAFARERLRADLLARDLAAVRAQIEAAKAEAAAAVANAQAEASGARQAAAASMVEHEQALASAREKGEALARDLAWAQAQIDAARADAAAAAAAQAEVLRAKEAGEAATAEREQALARDLAAAQARIEAAKAEAAAAAAAQVEVLKAKQAAEAAAAEREQALAHERERAEALGRDLAAAQAQTETAKAEAAAATAAKIEVLQAKETAETAAMEREQALARERERGEALARGLAAARAQIETAKADAAGAAAAQADISQAQRTAEAATAERDQALAREGERVDALTRDLGAARAEIEAVKTETAVAIQAQVEAARMKQAAEIAAAAQALVRERERADAITRDLAAARTEIDALKAPAALSPAITSSTVPLHRPGEAHDRKLVSVSAQRSERDQPPKGPAVASASVLDLKIASRGEPLSVPSAEAPAAAFGGVRPAQAAPASEDEARTLARAEALIRQGDIKGARLVLERATGAGGAHAWFALAETYDPRMLSSWRTFGIRGEPEKARELYGRAYAAGMIEAKERGETLK